MSAASHSPVTIITGDASGMGLAVAQDLTAKNWNITIIDNNEQSLESVKSSFESSRTLFTKVDVTNYEQQANAFVQTWNRWGRLDLVFANAGIGDRMNFYAPAASIPPNGARPNQNKSKIGKIVFTSSICGLYPGDSIPLYTAAKHGVVGLTRAMAKRLQVLQEPIMVNCVCPGMVDTGLTGILMAVSPPEYVNPKTTIVRAVTGFVDDASLTGQVAECSIENVHYRKQPEWADDGAEYIMTSELEAEIIKRGIKLGI